MGLFVIVLAVLNVVLLLRYPNCTHAPTTTAYPEIPVFQNDGCHGNMPASKLRLVERAEWGAQPPTGTLDELKLPVPYVIISQTAKEFCKMQSECVFRVRFAQTFHIESRNWSDIAYNFLVGGDGYAYVGRGWDSVGAHTYNYNARSIGISFIGTFNNFVPPNQQLLAAQELIALGVKAGKIATDYKLICHRQVSSTLSPGDALYNIIKTWPHWTNTSIV